VDRLLADREQPRLHVQQESTAQLNDWLSKGPAGWDSEEGWIVGMHDLLVPPIGARWRIAGSFDGDFTGLAPPAHAVLSLLLPALPDDSLALKLLRIGAVTHVTSLRENPWAGLEPLDTFPSVYTRPVRLYRVPDPLPRLYVVGGARTAVSDNHAMALLTEPGYDPRREVVLPATAPVHLAEAGFAGSVRLASRKMDRLAAEVETSAPGWLVAVESWDPGWKARVDGHPVEVVPANVLFCAVRVPAGRHHVELTYRPPGLAPGLLLSASAAGVGLGAVAARRRGKGRN
jgi:hypothetical protein